MSLLRRIRIPPLVLFLLAAFLTAVVGNLATQSSVGTWYPQLRKPTWTPPNWLFGPVWTFLYIAMAYAAWRVWRSTDELGAARTFRLYRSQLALNALWSILFFGLRQPAWALIEIIVFWAVIVIMMIWFWRVDRIAGALWSLYVAWVSFATALNAAIWNMNR